MDEQRVRSDYHQLRRYFDPSVVNSGSSFTSIFLLVIYFPIGLVLLLIRAFLLVPLILAYQASGRRFKQNRFFWRLCSAIFGFHTLYKQKEQQSSSSTDDNNKNLVVFLSNHITSLDFLCIRSSVDLANTSYFNDTYTLTSRESSWPGRLFLKLFVDTFHDTPADKDNINDVHRSKQSYPLIHFPELLTTNGRYGLLKFDLRPFEVHQIDASSPIAYKPICLAIRRPIMPLHVNCFNASDCFNILLVMFSPITIIEITALDNQFKRDNESSGEFAERMRRLIAKELNVTDEANDWDYEKCERVIREYHSLLRQQELEMEERRRLLRNHSRAGLDGSGSNQPSNTLSFAEISRVALQVKDILPDVSFETIQHHIRNSSSLDVDTVIASILDSGSETTPSSSPATSTRTQPEPSRTKLSAKMGGKSFEEKKFELLNEARKRYLAKHPI